MLLKAAIILDTIQNYVRSFIRLKSPLSLFPQTLADNFIILNLTIEFLLATKRFHTLSGMVLIALNMVSFTTFSMVLAQHFVDASFSYLVLTPTFNFYVTSNL